MSISVDKAVIARLQRAGERFEILVDPDLALEARSGKNVSIDQLAAAKEIFEDARKGMRASNEKISKAFGTNDFETIVKKIIKEGEVQITAEQREKMQEARERAVAAIISREGINPQTGTPHPIERVLRAMQEAKVRISIDKSAEEQVQDVLKSIMHIIPIRFEKIKIAMKVPPAYAAKSVSMVRTFGTIIKEEWDSNGSYIAMLEIPAGIQGELYDKMNALTHGEVQIKRL